MEDNVPFLKGLEAFGARHFQSVASDRKALEYIVAIRVSLYASRISSIHVIHRNLGVGNGTAMLVRYGAPHRTGIRLRQYRWHEAKGKHQTHTARICAKSIHRVLSIKRRVGDNRP